MSARVEEVGPGVDLLEAEEPLPKLLEHQVDVVGAGGYGIGDGGGFAHRATGARLVGET